MEETTTGVGLISGGLDSTVLAGYMASKYDTNYYVFCEYGQKTQIRERQAFEALCNHFQPQGAEIINMSWMRSIGRSALFEEETVLNAFNRKNEYVPFRNATLLTAAVALAETVQANDVLIGSTGGDTTCPDNSPAFVNAYQTVIDQGTMTPKQIELNAPLIKLDKKGVIKLGLSLNVPFELSWSCHNNKYDLACGDCSNCSSRRKAFEDLNKLDPIRYDDSGE